MKRLYVIAATAVLLSAPMAYAQNPGGAVGGAVGGAAVGGAVGGPAGAAVGGAVGAITGSSLPARPSVTYSGRVVVGEELPDTVTVYPVPRHEAYSYTILNGRRVIIERKTHKIVRVIQ